MDKMVFNHDKFNTWKTCKRRFYYKYIKELIMPEPETVYELGKEVHALAYYHLKGFDISRFINNLDNETLKHWESLTKHPVLKNKLIEAEWGFNSRIGDTKYWFIGRIDAIFYNENLKKYIIADWKTGQNIPRDPENSFQAMTYLYSLNKAHKDLGLNICSKDLIFQYIKTPDDINVTPIIYSEEKEKAFENIFIKYITEIENEKEYKSPEECPAPKFCQYSCLCFNCNSKESLKS